MSTSFAHNESLTTGVNRGWSFSVPAAAGDLQIALAYNDPASTTAAATNLVNDLDLNVKDPSGTWTNLVDDLNNLRILNFPALHKAHGKFTSTAHRCQLGHNSSR